MTTSESQPPVSEIAPPIVLDSRKAKVVALFAAAPGVALLCYWLYAAAHRFGLLPGTSRGAEDAPGVGWAKWAFASAVFLAVAVTPLYFAFKIWRRPTLKDLRRVPFFAAFCCYIGLTFAIIHLSKSQTSLRTEQELLVAVGNLLSLLLMLGAYFLVKNAMVIWFRTPELAQSGLQTNSRRNLWWWYCLVLWIALMTLGDDLVGDIDSALSYDGDPVVWLLIEMVIFVIAIYVAMYVYKKGLRPLGLRPD